MIERHMAQELLKIQRGFRAAGGKVTNEFTHDKATDFCDINIHKKKTQILFLGMDAVADLC